MFQINKTLFVKDGKIFREILKLNLPIQSFG